MNQELEALKQLIKEEADKLICETHPECCRLRDESYPKLEVMVLNKIFEEEEPVSAQTALAEIELELSHA